MSVIVIDGCQYTSKQEAWLQMRREITIIHKTMKNQVLDGRNHRIFVDLVNNRSDKDSYGPNSTLQFRVIDHPDNNGLIETQWCNPPTMPNWTPFSVKRCIVGSPKSDKAHIEHAMRLLVDDQRKAWLRSKVQRTSKLQKELLGEDESSPDTTAYDAASTYICAECTVTRDLQVDHFPTLFSELASDFRKFNPDLDFTTEENPNARGITRYRSFVSKETIKRWKDFHFEKARFRLLCGECNRKSYHQSMRGKKKP